MNRDIRKSHARWVLILVGLLFCSISHATWAAETITDHRVEVKIDERINIVPPNYSVQATLGLVRHPDGTIFLNTQRHGLYKSVDKGRTWTPSPVTFSDSRLANQRFHGLGVSSDGKLWLLHQFQGYELNISNSEDGGLTWITVPVDYANLAPGAPQHPYGSADQIYNTFAEGPDGAMMVSVELRYSNRLARKFQMADQSIPGMHSTMIRTTDGGKTWGDPASVHQYVAETSLAADPNDANHILVFGRKLRGLLPGEDEDAAAKRACIPERKRAIYGYTSKTLYKNGLLMESTDGGRSFSEVEGGMIGFYQIRGTLLWTQGNVIVATHQDGWTDDGHTPVSVGLAKISLDGGNTWVNGSESGAPFFNQAKTFELVSETPGKGYSSMKPTVELSPNHFLTAYTEGDRTSSRVSVKGVLWHIEKTKTD